MPISNKKKAENKWPISIVNTQNTGASAFENPVPPSASQERNYANTNRNIHKQADNQRANVPRIPNTKRCLFLIDLCSYWCINALNQEDLQSDRMRRIVHHDRLILSAQSSRHQWRGREHAHHHRFQGR